MTNCYKCNNELTDKNWYESSKKNYINLCIKCTIKKTSNYQTINIKKHNSYTRKYNHKHRKEEVLRTKLWRKQNPDKHRIHKKRTEAKRRNLETKTILNKKFIFSDLHHMGDGICIFIPQTLHRNTYHSLTQNINMDKINGISSLWIQEQQNYLII